MFKKFSLILLSALLFINSMALPAYIRAAEPATTETWYNQDFKSWLEKVDNTDNPSEIFGERYTSAQVQWIIYSLLSFLLHTNLPSNVVSCVFSNTIDLSNCKDAIQDFLTPKAQTTSYALPERSKNLWSLVFATDRPFSGISYVKSRVQNFGIIPVTYAQSAGFGFDALKPVQAMWRASRDVAFGLFILITVIFSFMIMFRVKISPQLVISIQSAIPKIVTALILVTFSYAIAGFLIDLMYVVIGILSIIISSFIPSILGATVPATVIFNMLTVGQPTGLPIQLGIFSLMFIYMGPLILTMLILTILGIFLSPYTAGLTFFIPFILLIIVVVVALWTSIKTLWGLLKAFVNLLLLTIFAPLQLAIGILMPSMGFGAWIKSYVSNLSVFVVTGALYWFSVIFLLQGIHIGLADIGFDLLSLVSGNFFGSINGAIGIAATAADYKASWPPLLGSAGSQGVGLLFLGVSFVLFTLIPKATEIIQGVISGKPFAYGSAVGEAFGPITGAIGYGADTIDRKGSLPWPLNKVPSLNENFDSYDKVARGRINAIGSMLANLLGGGRRR